MVWMPITRPRSSSGTEICSTDIEVTINTDDDAAARNAKTRVTARLPAWAAIAKAVVVTTLSTALASMIQPNR